MASAYQERITAQDDCRGPAAWPSVEICRRIEAEYPYVEVVPWPPQSEVRCEEEARRHLYELKKTYLALWDQCGSNEERQALLERAQSGAA